MKTNGTIVRRSVLIGTVFGLTLTAAVAPWRAVAASGSAAHSLQRVVLHASAVRHFPDGGMETDFDYNGVHMGFPVPPASFNPLKASDSDLIRYAFPARPAGGAALAQWQQSVAHMHIVPTWDIAVKPTQAGASNGKSSTTWVGYVDTAPTNATAPYFKQVIGDYVQPSVSAPTCSGSAWLGWVGIGGYLAVSNNANLLQAGTEWDTNYPGNEYDIFYELYPALNVQPIDFTIAAGHTAEASVTDLQTLPVPVQHRFDWSVWDKTVNNGKNGYVDYTGGAPTDLSAEWIDERPGENGGTTAPLANFGTDSWTYTDQVNAQGSGNATAVNPTPLTMVNSYTANPATTLAQSSTLSSSGTFSDTYKACS